jgi:hypothetical protein
MYIGTRRLKTKRLLREQEKKFTSLLINKDRFLRSGTLQSESNPFILCYTILPKFTVHKIQCAVMTYPLWVRKGTAGDLVTRQRGGSLIK